MLLFATIGTALLFGLALGSFLNVCIVRLPRDQSVVSPRSRCTHCNTELRNRDNVPLLSYLVLRGKCRSCGVGFSIRYPLIEAATAFWFGVSALPFARLIGNAQSNPDATFATGVHAASMCVFSFLLIGLIVMDWQHSLLPNEFTLGGLALGVLFAFAETFFVQPVPYKTLLTPEEVFLAGRLGAAAGGFLIFWSIGALYSLLRRRPGMGLGDAKLAAMMGVFLGTGPLAVALFFGISLAALGATFVLVTRRANAATRLPFGSYLGVAGLFASLWGEPVAHWYRSLFR